MSLQCAARRRLCAAISARNGAAVKFPALLLALSLACAASAADHPFGGTLLPGDRAALAAQLSQPDMQKRARAIVRLRADGRTAADDVKSAAERAETAAETSLRRLLQMAKPTDKSFEDAKRAAQEWKSSAEAARAIILVDHHKNPAKFAEMDKAFAKAQRAHDTLARLTKPGTPTPAAQILDALIFTAESRREKDWGSGKSADAAKLGISDVIKKEAPAIGIEQFVTEVAPFIELREYARLVGAAHAQMKWAKSEAVVYAELLNARRVIAGLQPLLLAEKLTAACAQHSEEMVKLKYFAHESPVAANKTPWDRVSNARFDGTGGGECIYAGNGTPQAAQTGWWYSDGHRLILYSEAQAQGIAKFGTTWTFLTGSFNTFPF